MTDTRIVVPVMAPNCLKSYDSQLKMQAGGCRDKRTYSASHDLHTRAPF